MRDYANIVSDALCIRNGKESLEVSEQVRKKFDDLLHKYIRKRRRQIKIRPVSIIFQNPETPYKRRQHRNGVTYIEESLAPVVRELPSLSEGEYYAFPSIEFIIERDGGGTIFFRGA